MHFKALFSKDDVFVIAERKRATEPPNKATYYITLNKKQFNTTFLFDL